MVKWQVSALVVCVVILLLIGSKKVTTLQSAELNETICIAGNGTWTTPQIAIGDDPASTKRNLTPYCSCALGYFWNDTLIECQNDSEMRCFQTRGLWINDSCQCPEGTIKWTAGFGCDMPGPEPKVETDIKKGFESSLPYLLVGLIIFALTIFYIRRKVLK